MSDDKIEGGASKITAPVSDGGVSILDRIFRSLTHQRQRYVFYYLRHRDHADIDDLAAQLAAWERGVPRDEVPEEEVERLKNSLHHVYLPKLDDYRLIEYDHRTGDVSYTHPPDILEKIVELAAGDEEPGRE